MDCYDGLLMFVVLCGFVWCCLCWYGICVCVREGFVMFVLRSVLFVNYFCWLLYIMWWVGFCMIYVLCLGRLL